MECNIGLEIRVRKQIAQYLSLALADTYVLYVKTQNFHWNIIDPGFYSLHIFLEKQYEELADGIDELAERIRMLGEKTPGTLKHFLEMTSIKEASEDLDANEMLKDLLNGHETISRFLRERIELVNKLLDQASGDLLIKQLAFHEKSAWMLRASIQTQVASESRKNHGDR
ncbi:MAG: DNA starvation/stationary phase protection protein [Parachlamydiaceae bacterium]|nr:DNA starvation/stationary phase protection protein [Parachlamydiaceae bacterium]